MRASPRVVSALRDWIQGDAYWWYTARSSSVLEPASKFVAKRSVHDRHGPRPRPMVVDDSAGPDRAPNESGFMQRCPTAESFGGRAAFVPLTRARGNRQWFGRLSCVDDEWCFRLRPPSAASRRQAMSQGRGHHVTHSQRCLAHSAGGDGGGGGARGLLSSPCFFDGSCSTDNLNLIVTCLTGLEAHPSAMQSWSGRSARLPNKALTNPPAFEPTNQSRPAVCVCEPHSNVTASECAAAGPERCGS